MSYNGWSNRETWLVNIHFNPESKADLEYAKSQIEELEDYLRDKEMMFLVDYVDFGLIDWRELEEALSTTKQCDCEGMGCKRCEK